MGLDFNVRHNVEAMFAHRQATLNNLNLNKALERLSSGYRINRASDDVAGLAVSEKLRAQVGGFRQAARNIQDGMGMIQTAEGGLHELHSILQRMRELAIQAANATYSMSDRSLIQLEVDQLLNEINRMQTSVEFNAIKLLDGTFSSKIPQSERDQDTSKPGNQLTTGSTYQGSMFFHVGANEGHTFKAFVSTLSVQALGLNMLFSSNPAVMGNFLKTGRFSGVLNTSAAESAIGTVDSAINAVSRNRARLGAFHNRLEHTLNFVNIAAENMQASESRIRDTDMAEEVIEFTKSQVLVQASQAMLAQANLKPTSILQLLS